MKSSLLLGLAAAALCHAEASAQKTTTTTTATAKASPIRPFTAPEAAQSAPQTGAPLLSTSAEDPLTLRNGATFTGIRGFWDYQSNGMMHGRIFMSNADNKKIYVAA